MRLFFEQFDDLVDGLSDRFARQRIVEIAGFFEFGVALYQIQFPTRRFLLHGFGRYDLGRRRVDHANVDGHDGRVGLDTDAPPAVLGSRRLIDVAELGDYSEDQDVCAKYFAHGGGRLRRGDAGHAEVLFFQHLLNFFPFEHHVLFGLDERRGEHIDHAVAYVAVRAPAKGRVGGRIGFVFEADDGYTFFKVLLGVGREAAAGLAEGLSSHG